MKKIKKYKISQLIIINSNSYLKISLKRIYYTILTISPTRQGKLQIHPILDEFTVKGGVLTNADICVLSTRN